jgi:hypothetical protein
MHRFSASLAASNDQVLLGSLTSLESRLEGVARNHHDCRVFAALRQMAGLSVASKPGQDEAVPV